MMAAISLDWRRFVSALLVMSLWNSGIFATEENSTIIPSIVQNSATQRNDSAPGINEPSTYTNPELYVNGSESLQRESEHKIDLNQSTVKNLNFSKSVEGYLDLNPTSVVPQTTSVAHQDISPEINSNHSESTLLPSLQSFSSRTSSHIQPTPTNGIDSTFTYATSVVNISPVGSPMSNLHLPTLSTAHSSTLASLVDIVASPSLFSQLPSASKVLSGSMDTSITLAAMYNASDVLMLPTVATRSLLSPLPSTESTSTLSVSAYANPVASINTKYGNVAETSLNFPLDPSVHATLASSDIIQASQSSLTASSMYNSSLNMNGAPDIYRANVTRSIFPSPTSTPLMLHTQRMETTTETHVRTWQDSVYQFVFEGNCSLLQASPTLLQSFLQSVKENLADRLSIAAKRFYTGNPQCGSVILNVTIEHTDMTAIDDRIMAIIASGNFSFSINNTEDGGSLIFQATGVKVLVSPSIGLAGLSSHIPEQTEPFEDSLLRGFWELSEMERILIIIFSVLGGFFFILAAAYIVHICCLRGQSKSFDLGDTPDHQVKLEDFTLTKLQRPPTIYDEHGMILTEDLHPGQTKMAIPYVAHGGHTCCHGHLATCKESPGLVRRANDSALHGSAENLVTHHATHGKDTGVDNMSFSSDDILGDGDGDGTDIDTDDDMSPARRPKPPAHTRQI